MTHMKSSEIKLIQLNKLKKGLMKHEESFILNELNKYFPLEENRMRDYLEFKQCYLQTIKIIKSEAHTKQVKKSTSMNVFSQEESYEEMLRSGFLDSLKFVQKDAESFSIVKLKPPNGRSTKYLNKMENYEKFWYNDRKQKCNPYNPFTAFVYEECNLREKAIDSIGNPIGNLYEYMVAKYIHEKTSNIKCINCKCKNCIVWNGGSGTSWQDLRCTECGCFYEIKAKEKWNPYFKAREAPLDRCLQLNIYGGSYSRFKEQEGINHILVIIDRGSLENNKHPVYCYNILNVFPSLGVETFAKWKRDGKSKGYRPKLKSYIKIDLDSKHDWFKLPKSEYDDPLAEVETITEAFLKEWLDPKFDDTRKQNNGGNTNNNNNACDNELCDDWENNNNACDDELCDNWENIKL